MTKKEIKLNLGVEEIVNLNNEGVLEEKTCFEALKKFDKEDLIEALLGNESLDNEEDLQDETLEDEEDIDIEENEDLEDENEEIIDIEEVEEKPIKKQSNNKEIDLDDDELANILD